MSSPGTLRQTLVRRWYVTLSGIIVTLGLVFGVSILVPATYEGKANMLLLQQELSGSNAGQNPFIALSGFLPFTDVVARSMQDTSVTTKLKGEGVHDPYTVARDLTTNGPVLLITIDGKNPDDVSRQLGLVVAQVPEVLQALQAAENVPADAQITSRTILQQDAPTTVRKSQMRAMLVAAALGLLATVAVASLIERRSASRSSAAEPSPAQSQSQSQDSSEPVAEEGIPGGLPLRRSGPRRAPAPGGRRRRTHDRQAS